MNDRSQFYSGSIPNFINGVSQQAISVRLASQCELQQNGYSSVVEGMRKRPPTEFVARLSSSGVGDAFIHTINRDTSERYQVVVTDGVVRVFDLLSGAFRTVNTPGGLGYLSTSTPSTDLAMVTVADYTFVVNKLKKVTSDSRAAPTRPPEAMVWVKQGAYGSTYKVLLNEIMVGEYKVPNGDVETHAENVQTDYIAEQLQSQIRDVTTGLTVYRQGSVIYIRHDGGPYTVQGNPYTLSDFRISVSDGLAGTALKLMKGQVQRFSDLPERAIDGFVLQITGDQSSKFDAYFVRYDTDGGTSSGVWIEAPKPGMKVGLDAGTMPHVLVREADGTFTFKPSEWVANMVGDEDTSPWPSFVDRQITDVFFHRNRLGFITDENVSMSRAGDYFNFFRQTTTQLLDTDPIDIGVSHTKVSLLRHVVPLDRELIMFSDQTQFVLTAGDLLTPKTAAVSVSTEFECSPRAKPVGTGRSVMFAAARGPYTTVRELFTDSDTGTHNAVDVTGHVPKYVPGGIYKLAVNSTESVLLALCTDAPNSVFVYQWYWSGNEKVQSAWHEWVFPGASKVLNVDFIGSAAYFAVERVSGGVDLERMNLEPARADTGSDFTYHLDSRVATHAVTASYSAVTNRTTFTLPFETASAALAVSEAGTNGTRPGQYLPLQLEASRTFSVKGDHRATTGWVGVPYTLRYRLSPLFVRKQSEGGGITTVQSGRLQLRSITFMHERTGYYRVVVQPTGARDEGRYPYTARVLGEAVLGEVAVASGTHRVPLLARNTDVSVTIENDSPLPCHILSAEWEGLFVARGALN